MMLATLTAQIEASPTLTVLTAIATEMWSAYGRGVISDTLAEALQEAIEARKVALAAKAEERATSDRATASKAMVRRGSAPRTPASTLRRRRWVASGWLPPAIAEIVTPAQAAVLAVIAWEISRSGVCRLSVGAIAGLAGVSETTVRDAVKAAKAAGLLSVTERRRPGQRSLTNLLVVTNDRWALWLKKRAPGGGCKSPQATNTVSFIDALESEKYNEINNLDDSKGASGKGSQDARPAQGNRGASGRESPTRQAGLTHR